MKYVAVIIGNLEVLQVYRLPNHTSTAIEVSLAMLPSWIQIVVRPINKSIIIIIQFFFSCSSSRSLFRIVYYRSGRITSLEHIQCTNLAKGLWSVLQSDIRTRYVVWWDGDSSTAFMERKCLFNNLRKSFGTDHANCFLLYTFRVSRRGDDFFFSLFDILITSVGFI